MNGALGTRGTEEGPRQSDADGIYAPSKKLRVLFLATEYPGLTHSGGLGTYTATIASGLRGRGHRVEVLVCARGRPKQDLKIDGTEVHVRPVSPMRWPGALPGLPDRLALALSFRQELAHIAHTFDVIQGAEFLAPTLLLRRSRQRALIVRLSSPARLLSEFDGEPVRLGSLLGDWLERRTARRAHAITAPNELLVERLLERGWLHGRSVEIVPTPVDICFWSGLAPADQSPPTILAVGRIQRHKGPDVLVNAAAKATRVLGATRLVFVGRSCGSIEGRSSIESIAEQAASLGVDCAFAGEKTPRELRRFYEQARVVAVAGRHDSWSNVALEALAAGRPVVSSTGSGISNLVQRLDPGAVVPAEDPDRLAHALLRYLSDPELAASVGAEGRRLVAEEFSVARVAEMWESTYYRVLDRLQRADL